MQQGPDLYVSFGNNNEADHDAVFVQLMSVEGKQEYTVPGTIDVSKYSQAIIYCKKFSVVFSVAGLK